MSVTFITPTIGRPELEACVASVRAQTLPVQHLVRHDPDRAGPAAIRNQLARQSEMDWLIPLDDDDTADPELAERLLAASAGADVVVPWCRMDDAEGLEPWTPNRLFRPETMLVYNIVPVTALVRRQLWLDAGGQPEGVQVEDYRFWRKMLGLGARFRVVPEVLWTYSRGAGRNQWNLQPKEER